MTKKLFIFFAFIFFFFISNQHSISADENFETYVTTEYKVQETGTTFVTNTISIKNKKSQFYPKSYIYKLSGIAPENIKAYELGNLLDIAESHEGKDTVLTINFSQRAVGVDNTKTFVISYEEKNLAKKSGEIWEITIPKLNDAQVLDEYKVTLTVPESFGEEAFISPEPISFKKQNGGLYYFFGKKDVSYSGVTAGFGKFQVFDFNLKYHLENNDTTEKQMEIALPPDTSTQRLFYDSIVPEPLNVSLDLDGNWLAKYNLKPGEKMEVEAKGSSQIFATPQKLLTREGQDLSSNLEATSYWQSDDPEIIQIAKRLNSPEAIYNYVVDTLSYNYTRVGENPKRLGAIGALRDSQNALCLEFTDLFIALARAKGIPAREINGFAYSQNPALEPLSLVSDILHAWPEYWDDGKKIWIPVDPTWGNTTGGVDFFNKFDLRHFAFVIHGKNAVLPYAAGSYKLGTEPKKDVLINFGQLPEIKSANIEVTYRNTGKFPLFSQNIKVAIKNTGNIANYQTLVNTVYDDRTINELTLIDLLPFSSYEADLTIPYGVFGSSAPKNIRITTLQNNVSVKTIKTQIILNQLLSLSGLFLSGILIYLLKSGNTGILKFNLISRMYGKFIKNRHLFKRRSQKD